MKHISKVLILGFLLSGLSSNLFAQRKKVREMEDNSYKVVMYDKRNLKKGNEDIVIIRADKIYSNFINEKHEFGASKVSILKDSTIKETDVVAEARIVVFEAETSNSAGEQVKWNVTIDGFDIEGTAVVSRKGKIKRQYEFSGAAKVKKVKKTKVVKEEQKVAKEEEKEKKEEVKAAEKEEKESTEEVKAVKTQEKVKKEDVKAEKTEEKKKTEEVKVVKEEVSEIDEEKAFKDEVKAMKAEDKARKLEEAKARKEEAKALKAAEKARKEEEAKKKKEGKGKEEEEPKEE